MFFDGASGPVSIGITELRSGYAGASLPERADEAPHPAKSSGRNRIEAP
ncbi:hypothetical protein [Oryzomonas rubra]|nr:hypothetical protein [Oryzomonas rubra]